MRDGLHLRGPSEKGLSAGVTLTDRTHSDDLRPGASDRRPSAVVGGPAVAPVDSGAPMPGPTLSGGRECAAPRSEPPRATAGAAEARLNAEIIMQHPEFSSRRSPARSGRNRYAAVGQADASMNGERRLPDPESSGRQVRARKGRNEGAAEGQADATVT